MNRYITKDIAEIMEPTEVLRIQVQGEMWREFYQSARPYPSAAIDTIKNFINPYTHMKILCPDRPPEDLPSSDDCYICSCATYPDALCLHAYLRNKPDVKKIFIIRGLTPGYSLLIEFHTTEAMHHYFPQ